MDLFAASEERGEATKSLLFLTKKNFKEILAQI